MAINLLPLLVEEDLGGDGPDAEPAGRLRIYPDIKEDDGRLAGIALLHSLENRRHHFAGNAARRP